MPNYKEIKIKTPARIESLADLQKWFEKYKKELENLKKAYDSVEEITKFGNHKRNTISPGFEFDIKLELISIPDEIRNKFSEEEIDNLFWKVEIGKFSASLIGRYKWINKIDVGKMDGYLVIEPTEDIVKKWESNRNWIYEELKGFDNWKNIIIKNYKKGNLKLNEMDFAEMYDILLYLNDAKEVLEKYTQIIKNLNLIRKEIDQEKINFKKKIKSGMFVNELKEKED